ncbi:MAG: chorismate-binding protein [Phycisphaerales bacterium]
MLNMTREQFAGFVARARSAGDPAGDSPPRGRAQGPAPGPTLVIPLAARLLSDQLTPVLAYRRLVAPDDRLEPSFLFESVEGGERQGRHSILGATPVLRVVASGNQLTIHDRRHDGPPETRQANDPLAAIRDITAGFRLLHPAPPDALVPLPDSILGGWVGYAAYDAARYAEPEKLSPANAPPDDRGLPEVQFGLYDGVVVFDHVDKVVHIVRLALVPPELVDPGEAYDHAREQVLDVADRIQRHSKPLASGFVAPGSSPAPPLASNTTRQQHAAMVERALEHIRAGDIFQVVIGQRFERRSGADPFDVYRALRVVNPSPYMVYLQADGCILVASSPEILCRVRKEATERRSDAATKGSGGGGQSSGGGDDGAIVLTNRPLAGTRRRGSTPEEDAALERELLADPKERAEHVMLVDLGRNDVGRVCIPGSVRIPSLMQVERYSHVMHISSTVTGTLRAGLDGWDALRATLPVGTISGAPKIRAMQIIDDLEPVRRGPYGGGIGWVGLDSQMDIALALRTMVVPTALMQDGQPAGTESGAATRTWMYHLQAAGGIVADSQTEAEYQETVNKSAAMARAIDLAEQAFAAP